MIELERKLFRRAVEAAGHSIYFTDANGVIEYVNPAFEETTGYTAEEAIGKTPRILKSGEHDRAFYEELWETILSGEVWRNELVNERKSGEQYVVDQTIAPVTDETGEVSHFVAINVDVTDRRTYERHLERQNERLDDFGSILSHDVKNLLTVAEGNVDLARETGDLSYLDRVDDAHSRMRELAEELLALARAGETVEERERVALDAVIADAWSTTATPEATLQIETGGVAVRADEDRLLQVFENLFRNAVEHGDSNVTIRVGVEDGRLYVADDGPGIAPEERGKVFEKGYTTSEEGTGYGLTLVENVVEAHGWDVDVTESETGGARFEIAGPTFEE
ncbi:two-component system sensor histidine kinase NtrB [Natronomonas marina]|jgi:PAS domain S-box-containing protein|uniref:two-component system sensor histidine kinase NtrB n=1 Tax=Natronomonas marina TaxID=2961939 RepID=UPI0020C96969|nr:PAS domain-containing sensor histidine kinase [Natronomonas marina]